MKIAVILPRVPYPLEKGDKLRAFHQIKYLSKNNDIYLYALDADNTDIEHAKLHLSPYCKEINIYRLLPSKITANLLKAFVKGLPLQVGYFFSKSVHKEIQKAISLLKPDHIYCQLIRTAEYAKNSSVPRTIDYQDVFSMGAKRRVNSASWALKPILWMEYKRLQRYETRVFSLFNNKTIISIPDRDFIRHPQKEDIAIIRNGVDFEFFNPEYKKDIRFDLTFTGNMSYAPNINAAIYLIKEIMPIVWKHFPNVTVQLAGATPDKKVLALASDKVSVTGWIDDIRDSYASTRIFIAPMQIGTGLQNKLLEAMAMKVPIITSELANKALKAEKDKEVLIGKTPEDYAMHIISLLDDDNRISQLTENAFSFVKENFSWDAATSMLEDLIKNK
ncbi:MAG: glycosyltransferase [Hyphomicrobiales bacterium]